MHHYISLQVTCLSVKVQERYLLLRNKREGARAIFASLEQA